jgi:hypothetical protein
MDCPGFGYHNGGYRYGLFMGFSLPISFEHFKQWEKDNELIVPQEEQIITSTP